MADRDDLTPIIDAIRDVEKSLDARIERTQGALMIMWGGVAALISLFYQLVTWNPDPYRAALGGLLPWIWVAPLLVGYAATVLVGVRVARVTGAKDARREALRDFLPAVVSGVIAAALVLAGHPERIAGALLLGFATTTWMRCRRGSGAFRSFAVGVAIVCAIAGVALLVWPFDGQWIVCAIAFGGGLAAIGRARMLQAE